MVTIRVSGTVRQVIRSLNKLPTASRGSTAARKMLTRIGEVVLGFVSKAFEVKSKGGTDEAGDRWKALSPFTVAYHRKHTGLLWPQSKRAKFAPSAALKKKQRDRWWAMYASFLGKYRGNKAMAARSAWRVLKGEGATTIMDRYGSADVPILNETGKLYNSLLPPVGTKRPLQVFKVARGYVEVGTKRKWAWTHHKGARGIPQRRLWPPPSEWAESWWRQVRQEVTIGIGDIVRELVQK